MLYNERSHPHTVNDIHIVVFIDNKSAYVQEMAWCRTGNKPLPELMLSSVMLYCGVIRPQLTSVYGGEVT